MSRLSAPGSDSGEAQTHNPFDRVKHPTTEPLRSLILLLKIRIVAFDTNLYSLQ